MPHRLEKKVHEYIWSRLKAISGIVPLTEADLLPAEVAGAKLGQRLKDINLAS